MNPYELDDLFQIASLVQTEAKKNRNTIIKSEYDSEDPDNKLEGLCYVVSETMYHLTGGKDTWTPKQIEHEGVSHWFLVHKKTGRVFDLTESQFDTSVPHRRARGRGFCTENPSKRAVVLIEKVKPKV